MKKKIMYFVMSFALAMTTVFAFSSTPVVADGSGNNSCKGRCGSALKVCMRDCKTQGQIQACKKKYERCCSSCSD